MLRLCNFYLLFCLGYSNFCFSVDSFDISRISRDENSVPVLILGGGCAGLCAAVYCAQANMSCVVIDGPKPGGALAQANSVRNWPGVVQQSGSEIINGLRSQAEQSGVKIVSEKVVAVDMSVWPRIITTQTLDDASQIKMYRALAVIIALGSKQNLLGIPGEWGVNGYWSRGVCSCAVCEGFLYHGKNVAVVGGGDSAIVEADYLSNIAAQVTLFLRGSEFRAKKIKDRDRVLAKPNVRVLFNTEVTEIKGDGHVMTHVMTTNNLTGAQTIVPMDGLFLAIGSKPNSDLLKGHVVLDEQGLVVLKKQQETSVRGVFAAGDICALEFMQGVTALGDTSKVATQIRSFFKEIGFTE